MYCSLNQVAARNSQGTEGQRWVALEDIAAVQNKLSQHITDLVAHNKKLLDLCDEAQTRSMYQQISGYGRTSTEHSSPGTGKERLEHFIRHSNQLTSNTDGSKSKEQLEAQVMAQRQQLEITRAMYLSDLHGVVAKSESDKQSLLRDASMANVRADQAEMQLRRTEVRVRVVDDMREGSIDCVYFAGPRENFGRQYGWSSGWIYQT